MKSTSPKIEFKKDSVKPLILRKFDRLLVSGPCEISIDAIKTDVSLDYIIQVTLSMPNTTETIKLGFGSKYSNDKKETIN